jgi:hypothetical protein
MTSDVTKAEKAGLLPNIYTPSLPGYLRVTQTMVEDFICDPCLGARVLFGEELDAFQRARLKLWWWVPRVMDSSGFSSAKTRCLWIVSNLRCLLIPDHVSAIYYQTFTAGQQNYWKHFLAATQSSAIFRAHIGRMNEEGTDVGGKATLKGPSMWTCDYRNGSQVMMPAPGFLTDARTSAGFRFNDLYIDEWTKAIAGGSSAIDDQLIGRSTREAISKYHPLWANKNIFLATAEDSMHAGYEKYDDFVQDEAKGNPECATVSFHFKDYSDMPGPTPGNSFKDSFREDRVLADMKKGKTEAGYLQEGFGIWSKNGRVWYSEDQMKAAQMIGASRGLRAICNRKEDREKDLKRLLEVFYFLGIDPARAEHRKADDGALVILRAQPKVVWSQNPCDWWLDFVWAYKVRKADAPDWAAIIHRKEKHFDFAGLLMDPGGGGVWIQPELAKTVQHLAGGEQKVLPIACIEDEATTMVRGKFVLSMFRPTDYRIGQLYGHMNQRHPENLVDSAHTDFQEAWEKGYFGLPPKLKDIPEEEKRGWSQERQWAHLLLQVMAKQLTKVTVLTAPDGTVAMTSRNARQFGAKGKKDFAYAGLYAYIRFLAWLKAQEASVRLAPEDEAQCG